MTVGYVPSIGERDPDKVIRSLRNIHEFGFDFSILTDGTSVAVGDTFPFYDLSEAQNRRVTPVNLLEVINVLDEETSPDLAADFMLLYDTSASTVKKVKPENISPASREILSANRTYYVRTDGSDSNTGLVDSAGGAFLTIQKAIDTVAALDLSTFDVTIQVGAGTYTATNALKTLIGAGEVTILGDATTPGNVIISTTSADCFSASNIAGRWKLNGLKLTTTTGGLSINVQGPTVSLDFLNIEFGAAPGGHISAAFGAYIAIQGNYSITGNAPRHISATNLAVVAARASLTCTLTGTPAFSVVFANAARLGNIEANIITYAGSATGTRYAVIGNAAINTGGGGANFFPGNAAGSTTPDGEYA